METRDKPSANILILVACNLLLLLLFLLNGIKLPTRVSNFPFQTGRGQKVRKVLFPFPPLTCPTLNTARHTDTFWGHNLKLKVASSFPVRYFGLVLFVAKNA